jgi:hypothetical protein
MGPVFPKTGELLVPLLWTTEPGIRKPQTRTPHSARIFSDGDGFPVSSDSRYAEGILLTFLPTGPTGVSFSYEDYRLAARSSARFIGTQIQQTFSESGGSPGLATYIWACALSSRSQYVQGGTLLPSHASQLMLTDLLSSIDVSEPPLR